MPYYDPEAEHIKMLPEVTQLYDWRSMKEKTISNIKVDEERMLILFEDDSIAIITPYTNSPPSHSHFHIGEYGRVKADEMHELGLISDEKYERHLELKKEYREEMKEKERRNRYESLKGEFGPDLSDEEIGEIEEILEENDLNVADLKNIVNMIGEFA